MGEESQRVGIPLEMNQIGPLLWREFVGKIGSEPLGEEGGDGFFARMSEGRVAQVVGQTGSRHYVADRVEGGCVGRILVGGAQGQGDLVGHRASHRRHFEAVGETVVHEDAPWQGEHLRLIL